MIDRAERGDHVAELAGLGLGARQHVGERLDRRILRHQVDERIGADHGDEAEGVVAIEREFPDRGAAGIAGGEQRHGVAVGRRMRDDAGRDAAAAAGVVLDRDRLAERAGHLVGEQPADDVRAAARRGADQDAQRALRPVLLGAGGQRRPCGDRRRRAQGFGGKSRSVAFPLSVLPVSMSRLYGDVSKSRGELKTTPRRCFRGAKRRTGSSCRFTTVGQPDWHRAAIEKKTANMSLEPAGKVRKLFP